MLTAGTLDQLQQVHELNRAFLALAQVRAREGRDCFGLAAPLRTELAAAGEAALEGAACFPRALFHLSVVTQSAGAELAIEIDEAEHDLTLSILLAVRHASRHSAYQARLLFGLDATDVERLRGSPLTLLQQLASSPGVLHCAFRDRLWFWRGLLTATRPELRRQLTLMALQPGIAAAWPVRRAPRASV